MFPFLDNLQESELFVVFWKLVYCVHIQNCPVSTKVLAVVVKTFKVLCCLSACGHKTQDPGHVPGPGGCEQQSRSLASRPLSLPRLRTLGLAGSVGGGPGQDI